MRRLRDLLQSLAGAGSVGTAVRAAAAVAIPLVVGQATGHEVAGLFAALGALNVALADTGGPFVERTAGLTAALVGVVAAIALGSSLSGHPWAVVPVLVPVGFVCGLVRQIGETGLRVGMVVAATFVFGAGIPGAPETGERTLAALAGGVFAIALIALVWPFEAERPSRLALAEALRLTGAYIRSPAATSLASARDAIDRARAELESLGALRGRSSTRLVPLVVAIRGAARLFAAVAIATKARDRAALDRAFPRPEIDRALVAIAGALERLAAEAATGPAAPPTFTPPDLGEAVAACAAADDEDARLAGRALELSARHVATVAGALSGQEPGPGIVPFRPGRSPAGVAGDLARSFRAELAPGSGAWRYALKLGLAMSLAMTAALAIGVERVYWAPLTVVMVLQPGARETLQRARDRVAGTVIGAVLASLVLAVVSASWLLDVLVFTFMTATLLLFTHAYRWAVVALTILVLALIETVAPSGWELAAYRVADTLLGAAIGIAIALLVWPVPRRHPFLDRLADAVRALAEVERALAATYIGRVTPQSPTQLCRAAGRALTAADAARADLQPGGEAEGAARAVAGGRKALDGLVALDAVRPGARSAVAERVEGLVQQIRSALADLELSLEREQEPADPPALELGLASAHAHAEDEPVDVHLALTELGQVAAGIGELIEGSRLLLARGAPTARRPALLSPARG